MESGTKNSNPESKSKPKKKAVKSVPLPATEEVGSFLENIKIEWNLFWAGIAGEDDPKAEVEDPFESGKLQILSIEQVKQITRALSQDRKKINQRIELVHREIELNHERIESIKLVGGDQATAMEEIDKLNELGMKLSLQLEKVSGQLDRFRSREDELKGLR